MGIHYHGCWKKYTYTLIIQTYYRIILYLSTECSLFHLWGTKPTFLCSSLSKCFGSLRKAEKWLFVTWLDSAVLRGHRVCFLSPLECTGVACGPQCHQQPVMVYLCFTLTLPGDRLVEQAAEQQLSPFCHRALSSPHRSGSTRPRSWCIFKARGTPHWSTISTLSAMSLPEKSYDSPRRASPTAVR